MHKKKSSLSKLLHIIFAPVRFVLRIFALLEKILYLVRDFVWAYPDFLFIANNSLRAKLQRFYEVSRPYSHVLLSIGVTTILFVLILQPAQLPLAAKGNTRLVEAVVMGTNEQGRVQNLPKINPLLSSSIQLERDLSQIIYQPLISYEQDGGISRVLADEVLRIKEGAEYEFVLKDGVTWHDGEAFTVDDVLATLELVDSFDVSRNSELNNAYVQAIKQMEWEKTGSNSIRLCTTSKEIQTNLDEKEKKTPCTAAEQEKPILSNFLELVSIKIMPEHKLGQLNTLNVTSPKPEINRFPVGTGPYQFVRAQDNYILLSKYTDYYGEIPQIDELKFKLFSTEHDAVQALQNGEVHSFATASTRNIRDLEKYPQIAAKKSPVLQNQYWGIYFNMRKGPDGDPIGPEFFQDVQVRKAIDYAVDKQRVQEVLFDVGEIATGPIHPDSDFYNEKVDWRGHDIQKASQLLQEAGWKLNKETGIREKNGNQLSFTLSFAENPDREKVVESIKQDLKAAGIELKSDPRNQEELLQQLVLPKLFDSLFYGMRTFIDADRYELFHSEQELLNLSSYKGSVETAKIEDQKTVRLPKVDRLLELGRSYDPLAAKDKRIETYKEFQKLLHADAPLVFLYHPQFLYYINQEVENVNLQKANSLEERFVNVENWKLAE